MAYVSDFTALTTGKWRWNMDEAVGTPTVVTYSFLEGGELPSYAESPPYDYFAGNRYVTMTAAQRTALRDALSLYEAQSGLRFVEVDDPADASVKLLANQSSNLTSWAYYPKTPNVQGDIHTGDVFVTITYDPAQGWTLDSSRGSEIFTVMLHEMGHAIGLQHPHEGVLLTPSMDNHDYTIMSYDWSWAGDGTGRARDSLAPLDVQAIRYLYGATAGYTAVWNPAGQFIEINGGAGDDRIVTGRADSLMLGGSGNDRLTGAQFDDTLKGGSGDDRLDGGAGTDLLQGQQGHDRIFGGGGDDQLLGGSENDRLHGEAGRDRLVGGDGNDQLSGGDGNDDLRGQDGNDWLSGGGLADQLSGGAGADTLTGGAGEDGLRGDTGNDLLSGDGGADLLDGGAGDDRLNGGGGGDNLMGAQGQDTLVGDAGQDTLFGGTEADRLMGGAGADIFVFRGYFGRDTVLDWEDGIDRIDLSRSAGIDDFGDLAPHARQNGENVVIKLGLDQIVVLKDADLSDLDGRDFIF